MSIKFYKPTEDYTVGSNNPEFHAAMQRTLDVVKQVRSVIHIRAYQLGGAPTRADLTRKVYPALVAEFPGVNKELLQAQIVDHTHRRELDGDGPHVDEFVLPGACVYPLKKLGKNDGNYEQGRYVTFWSPGQRGVMAVPRRNIPSAMLDRVCLFRVRVRVFKRKVQVTFCFSASRRARRGIHVIDYPRKLNRVTRAQAQSRYRRGILKDKGGESDGHEERQEKEKGRQGLLT